MKNIRKNDILLNIAIIALCILAYAAVYSGNLKKGNFAVISVDGESVYTLPLKKDNKVTVNGVTVVIENGKAYVTESDCPDGLCIKMKKAEKISDSVVCVPNRVSIRIVGESEEGDIIAG